ncbi:MAG: hypothetical protein Q8S46_01065 [Methylotenera sp.]|nr:hypothetical protein [Methylotenera sp.]MDP1755113.1 hypothetical protein [Methylotenera sp.]MDP1958305.1 hypothetical protein [Methylotenera sp.]MDP3206970.1 hypothetical protein [Methylotenera sp.]MDP3302730.1 hypothetical protein [Methylotenera sp.]
MDNVLTESQFKRIEKLATDAGRSVKQIMPHVLKHDLLELERVVKSVKHGIADAEKGAMVSHEQVIQELDAILAKYEKKAAWMVNCR